MNTDKIVLKHALLIYDTYEYKTQLPEHLKYIAEDIGSLSDNIELITHYIENKTDILRKYASLAYVPIEIMDDLLRSDFEGDNSGVLYGYYRDEITRVSHQLYVDEINLDEFKHKYGLIIRLQRRYRKFLRAPPLENDPNFVLQPLTSNTGNEYILK